MTNKVSWKTNKTHISVRRPNGPGWRGGKLWQSEPTIVAKASLSDEAANLVLTDMALLVEEVDDPNPPAKKGDKTPA